MPFVPIAASVSGANTVVAGVPGRRIRVLGYVLVSAGAVSLQWQDSTPANLSGVMGVLAAAGTLIAPVVPPILGHSVPWMETGSGQALILNLSAAVGVNGHLCYDVA